MPPASEPLPPADWSRLLTSLGATPGQSRAAFADLARHYGGPDRHYHNLEHAGTVQALARSLWGAAQPSPAVELAAWYHDVVYDPRAGDNEERSAAHARQVLHPLGLPDDVLGEMARLILLTRTHEAGADDRPGQVLLDADLAILGADEEAYDGYARAIRQEYAWVPEEQYRKGRTRVLETLLHRPRLYHTEVLHTRAEARARQNMGRELNRLKG